MNRSYTVLFLLAAVLQSSAALANYNLYASEYQKGAINSSVLNSTNAVKGLSGMGWKDVDIANDKPGNYAVWMGDTTSNDDWQITFAQFTPSLRTSIDNEQTGDLRVETSLLRDTTVENSDISAQKNHESAVADSASILLFCFGVGITGLTSIRKKIYQSASRSALT